MKRLELFVAVTLAFAISANAQQYHVTQLPLLAGPAQGFAVNRSGQVAGYFQAKGSSPHGFLWSKTAGLQDLGIVEVVSNLNDSGQVTGAIPLGNSVFDAFRWTPSGGIQDLGSLGGSGSWGVNINASGQIAGTYHPTCCTTGSFLWTPSGGLQDLGFANNSSVYAMNDAGQVLGDSPDASGNYHAVLWSPSGGVQQLIVPGSTLTHGASINSSGEVVGDYSTSACQFCGFVWTPNSGFQTFAPLANAEPVAKLINSSGEVAGDEASTVINAQAFFRSKTGVIQGLGVLPGDSSSSALALNGKGEVFGKSCHKSRQSFVCHYFLWNQASGLRLLPINQAVLQYSTGTELNDAGQIVGALNGRQVVLLSPYMHVKQTSSLNPSKSGQSVTLTAAITSVEGAPPNGELVTFEDGSTVLGTAAVIGGVAKFTTSVLMVGTHSITAAYAGDVNYDPSVSGVVSQVVKP